MKSYINTCAHHLFPKKFLTTVYLKPYISGKKQVQSICGARQCGIQE